MLLLHISEKKLLSTAYRPTPDPSMDLSSEQITSVLKRAYGIEPNYNLDVRVENNSAPLFNHRVAAEINLTLIALWRVGSTLEALPEEWNDSPLKLLASRLLRTPEHMFKNSDTEEGQIKAKNDLIQIKRDLEEILILFAYKLTRGVPEQLDLLCDFNQNPAASMTALNAAIANLSTDNPYELRLMKQLFVELCAQAGMCTDGLKSALTMVKADLKEKDLNRHVADHMFNIILATRDQILVAYAGQNSNFAKWISANDVHLVNFLVKRAVALGYDLSHAMPLANVDDQYEAYINGNIDINYLYLLERNLSKLFTLPAFIQARGNTTRLELQKIFDTLKIQVDDEGYCLCTDFATVEADILRLLKRLGILPKATMQIENSLVNFKDDIAEDITYIYCYPDNATDTATEKFYFEIVTPNKIYNIRLDAVEAKSKFSFLTDTEAGVHFTAGEHFEQLKLGLCTMLRKKKIANIELHLLRNLAASGLSPDVSTIHVSRALRLHMAHFNNTDRNIITIENQGIMYTLDYTEENFDAKFEILKLIIEQDLNTICLPLILTLFSNMNNDTGLYMLTRLREIPTAVQGKAAWEMVYEVAASNRNTTLLRFLVDHDVDPTLTNYIPINAPAAFGNTEQRNYYRSIIKAFASKSNDFWKKSVSIIYTLFPDLCPQDDNTVKNFESAINALNADELAHLFYGLVKMKPINCRNIDHAPWVRESIIAVLLTVLDSKSSEFFDEDSRIIDFLLQPEILETIAKNHSVTGLSKLRTLINLCRHPIVASKVKTKVMLEAATAEAGRWHEFPLILGLALFDVQLLASYGIGVDFFALTNERILFNELRAHVIRQRADILNTGFAALTMLLLYCVDHSDVANAIDHLYLEIDPASDERCLIFAPLETPNPFTILADHGFSASLPLLIEHSFKSERYKTTCLPDHILTCIKQDKYIPIADLLISKASISGYQIMLAPEPDKVEQADLIIRRFSHLATQPCAEASSNSIRTMIRTYFNTLSENDYKFVMRRFKHHTQAYRDLVSFEVFTAINIRIYPGIYDDIRDLHVQIWGEGKRLCVAERVLESFLAPNRETPSPRPLSAASSSQGDIESSAEHNRKRARNGL